MPKDPNNPYNFPSSDPNNPEKTKILQGLGIPPGASQPTDPTESNPRSAEAYHIFNDASLPTGSQDPSVSGQSAGALKKQLDMLQQMKTDIQHQQTPQSQAAQMLGHAQFNNFMMAKGQNLGQAATYNDQANAFRQGQLGLMNQLQQQAAGQGPSLAGMQLRQAQESNLAQQAALAASQGGRNAALTQRGLATQAAGAEQQTANAAAQARMQEQLNAQQQLGGLAGQARGADIGVGQFNAQALNAQALNQAQLNQQLNLTNQQQWNQVGMYNASNAQQKMMQNAQMQQQTNLANQQAALNQEQITNQAKQYVASQGIASQQWQQQQQEQYEQWLAQQQLAQQALAQGQAQFNVSAGLQQQGLTAGYIGAGAAVGGALAGIGSEIIGSSAPNAPGGPSDRKLKKSIDRADGKLDDFLDYMHSTLNTKSLSDENQKELQAARLNVTPENAQNIKAPGPDEPVFANRQKPQEKSAGEKALGVLGNVAEAVSAVMSPVAWSSQKIIQGAQDSGKHQFLDAPSTTAGQVAGILSPKSSFTGALSDVTQKDVSAPQPNQSDNQLSAKLAAIQANMKGIGQGIKNNIPSTTTAVPSDSKILKKIMSGEQLTYEDYTSVSDEDEKDLGSDKLTAFLNHVKPYEYSYKNPDMPGAGHGRFVSPMAQDLEKSELGKSAVTDTPQGKMVNYAKLQGVLTAGLAMEHDRINKIEQKLGIKRGK